MMTVTGITPPLPVPFSMGVSNCEPQSQTEVMMSIQRHVITCTEVGSLIGSASRHN